jgi:guanine deaminase
MQAFRAAILRFGDDRRALYEEDGLLVIGPDAHGRPVVRAVGPHDALARNFPGVRTEDLRGRILAPGFIDLHIHFPQLDVIGSPAAGLLPWLENYTFPHEARFSDPAHARELAVFFVEELLRHGVTSALAFGTSHPGSVDALLAEAQARGMRLIAGKVLQDRHSPDGVRDETEQSLLDTESLIQRWQGVDRLGYAITPRFAPSCTDAQLRGAGELAAKYPGVWIQSHVAENREEIAWARELFPQARSYLSVYEGFGLMRERAVYAHCIHIDDEDRRLLRSTGAAAGVSPTSNLFLGSGFFDYEAAQRIGFHYGLASDVGGGTSFSPFHTMLAAYYVGREGQTKPGVSLSPHDLWWQHTAGAALALGLGGVVGNLAPGCEADFIVIDPKATPLLARKSALAASLEELLFALIVLGDDRAIERAYVGGSLEYGRTPGNLPQ